MRKLALTVGIVSVAAAVIIVTAACGGDGGTSATVIDVSARDFRFTPGEIRVPAGQEVTLRLKNLDEMEHDLEVQGLRIQPKGNAHNAGGHAGAMPGMLALHTAKRGTASITFTAEKKGTYDVWCTISGHKELGMMAKLVVN